MLPNSATPQEHSLQVGESGPSGMHEFNDDSRFESNPHSFQWQAYGGGDRRFDFDTPFGLGLTPPLSFPTSASQELQHGFKQAGTAAFRMPHTQASSSSQGMADATSTPTSLPESSLQERPSLLNVRDIHLERIGSSESMRQEAPMDSDYESLDVPARFPPLLSRPASKDAVAHSGMHRQDPSIVKHRRGYTSASPLGRGREDVDSKLVRKRTVRQRDRQLKIVEYKHVDTPAKAPVAPPQPPIIVDGHPLNEIIGTSQ
ncbi:hypothetical protein EDD22DRAFT_952696 [Suillus occidentalis]|nr:hypothetical protein EDD22DRAFT_952696 [Suillus occidentalis]